MLWKLLLSLASIIVSPFRAPDDRYDPPPSWEPSRFGPQTWEKAIKASQALQGVNDDILNPEDAGIKDETFRWPGYPGAGIIPYVLDADVREDRILVGLIAKGILQWEENTCIRFVKRTNETKYVKIIKDSDKCYSYVGMQKDDTQPQSLSLGIDCEFIGTVVHELGHAIGLFHEHQRSDRDTYLNVYEENVKPESLHNFHKTAAENEEYFEAAYDYTSIMHYGHYAFTVSLPGDEIFLKTMDAKDGTPLKEPYERAGLNNHDIDLVKKLYKCP